LYSIDFAAAMQSNLARPDKVRVFERAGRLQSGGFVSHLQSYDLQNPKKG
jgi:hypothetical protein